MSTPTPMQASEPRSNVIGFGRWTSQAPIAAEAATEQGAEAPAKVKWPRERGISVYGVMFLILFALSACFVGAVIFTGWRLARGLF